MKRSVTYDRLVSILASHLDTTESDVKNRLYNRCRERNLHALDAIHGLARRSGLSWIINVDITHPPQWNTEWLRKHRGGF